MITSRLKRTKSAKPVLTCGNNSINGIQRVQRLSDVKEEQLATSQLAALPKLSEITHLSKFQNSSESMVSARVDWKQFKVELTQLTFDDWDDFQRLLASDKK